MSGYFAGAFGHAETHLAKGRNKNDRPYGTNTRLRRIDADTIAVVFHSTAVVTMHRDGTFTIYGGGWNTPSTRRRISEHSPFRPSSDGNGGWIAGQTGERTPSKKQKCRTCKHRGTWMEDDWCHGPSAWGADSCTGATTVYDVPMVRDENSQVTNWREHFDSRREQLCEHGEKYRHATKPCQHGEHGRHVTGQSQRTCYKCDGTGIAEYGDKPIPLVVDADTAFRVDTNGMLIDPTIGKKPATEPVTAIGPDLHYGSSVVDSLRKVLPNIDQVVRNPVTGDQGPVTAVIIYLNDVRRWPRERIADWLDTLDIDLRFPAAS
ncbi:MAG: hypothetical protein ABWZ30_01045 [Jiangellaceae bacterium]